MSCRNINIMPLNSFVAFLLILSLSGGNVQAEKLGEFKENTQKEEKSGKSKKNADNDKSSNILVSFLADIFAAIWYDINKSAEYDSYPYASEGRNYIKHSPRPGDDSSKETAPSQTEDSHKRWYFLPEASFQYLDAETISYTLNFHSRFGSIAGPYASFRQYRGKTDGNLGYYQGGLDLALIQIEVFNLSYYLGFAGFSGILERTGLSTGLEITLLSFQPICLNLRAGTLNFERISYGEFALRMGFIAGRSEIFAGYHHLSSETAKLEGFETGIRYWL